MVALKHSYWHGRALGRGLSFFITKWENETNKPRFISRALGLEKLPIELRVRLGHGNVRTRIGRFFFVSIANIGGTTAEDVRAFVNVLEVPALGQVHSIQLKRLQIVPPLLDAYHLGWEGRFEEFDAVEHNFADALLAFEKNKESVRLDPLGIDEPLLLFFTLENSDILYFPSEAHVAMKLPSVFTVALYLQAKDMPAKIAGIFQVDAKAWNDFSPRQIPIPKEIPDSRPALQLG